MLLIDCHGARLMLLGSISSISSGVGVLSFMIILSISLVVIIVVRRIFLGDISSQAISLGEDHLLGFVRSLDLVGLCVDRAKLCRLSNLASCKA